MRNTPSTRTLRHWLQVIGRIFWRSFVDQIGLISAGVAFYALLAIFPAIAALVALAGLFADPGAVIEQLENLGDIMPDQAAAIILDQAKKVAGASNEGLSLTLTLGVIFAIYLSTRATTGLIHGLNVAHRCKDNRGLIAYWSTVILLTIGLMLGAVLMSLLLVGLPTVLAFLPWARETFQAVATSRWIVVVFVLLSGLSFVFRFGPADAQHRWVWFSPGIFLAVILWFAASLGFAAYVENFGRYNETFGSLGGVIVLLTWLWLSAYIVLMAAIVDFEFGRLQTSRPGPAEV
ncbi:MAG: YihY/virulence factor BrkB family protein [Boseongicola sp.]